MLKKRFKKIGYLKFRIKLKMKYFKLLIENSKLKSQFKNLDLDPKFKIKYSEFKIQRILQKKI